MIMINDKAMFTSVLWLQFLTKATTLWQIVQQVPAVPDSPHYLIMGSVGALLWYVYFLQQI